MNNSLNLDHLTINRKIEVYNKFKEDPILGGFVSKLQEIDSFYKKSLDDGTLTEVNSLMKMENYFYLDYSLDLIDKCTDTYIENTSFEVNAKYFENGVLPSLPGTPCMP